MKRLGFVFAALAALVLAGYAGPPKQSAENAFFEQGADGWVRYFTNDKSKYGFQQRQVIDNPNPSAYEMDVRKISGFENMGFGMMFNAADSNNGYVVLVYVNGGFMVRKLSKGTVSNISAYEVNENVKTGFGEVNNIKVVNSQIFLNGVLVYTLTDTSIKGNKIGYYVLIGGSGYEKLPGSPVEVLFKIK